MIITLENFTKSYGEKQLFAGVNLSMDAGDKVGIVGVNGTGKSTFLKAIAGLVPVDDGTMVTMRGLRIEYLAQDKVFDPEHTVLMEVFRGMTPLMDALRGYELALAEAAKDPESPAIQKRIMQYAEKIDELDGWQVESTAKTVLQKLGIGDYTAKAGTLSGGQQKRLALATALIQPCDLLLLDEPTNHLDSETIAWLEEYLRGQKGALLMRSCASFSRKRASSARRPASRSARTSCATSSSGCAAAHRPARRSSAPASSATRRSRIRRSTSTAARSRSGSRAAVSGVPLSSSTT